MTPLKELVKPFMVLLNPLLWLLLDGIQFDPNVISINITILLQNQGS
jgi:hypothetical protein